MKAMQAAALLLPALLLCGCAGKETAVSRQETARMENEGVTDAAPATGDIHITVESCTVTEEELARTDRTVPVRISLDQNSGLVYSEWGIRMDERCLFDVDAESDEPVIEEYYSVSNENHFLWTAWASGRDNDTLTGVILVLNVQLPEDAAAGDVYTVDYADMSLVDKPHVWQTKSQDWVKAGSVTWTDGTITVVAE